MIRPTLDHAVAFNRSERREDEWFDELDDLYRVQRALDSIEGLDDVVDAAAVLAYRVARAQGFGEGNKRMALLRARWLLDRNGEDGLRFLPPDDHVVADLLVAAAGGRNVEKELVDVLVRGTNAPRRRRDTACIVCEAVGAPRWRPTPAPSPPALPHLRTSRPRGARPSRPPAAAPPRSSQRTRALPAPSKGALLVRKSMSYTCSTEVRYA